MLLKARITHSISFVANHRTKGSATKVSIHCLFYVHPTSKYLYHSFSSKFPTCIIDGFHTLLSIRSDRTLDIASERCTPTAKKQHAHNIFLTNK